MAKFEEQKFNIPALKGISVQGIEAHLKLYSGYVKNVNLIYDHFAELMKDSEKYAYELGELQRRFSFEFDGMRNHEYYFHHFEGSANLLPQDSKVKTLIETEFGSFDAWLARFKAIALTRGVGYAILYHDPMSNRPINAWVDEHHQGQLIGLKPLIALDVWEHAFIIDYLAAGKKAYVDDFFANLNWQTVEKNLTQ